MLSGTALNIRRESRRDLAGIRLLHRAAFRGDSEARLVDRLRGDGSVIASLVAVDQVERVIGHILFSPATIASLEGPMEVASLAPLAVLPSHQHMGVGLSLVEQGIEICRRKRFLALIVVGHPDNYARFGFSHAHVRRIQNPFATGDAFMGLELAAGILAGIEGTVVYPPAFDDLV